MSRTLDSATIRRALDLPPGEGDGRRYTSVAIDSREVEPGALFVALEGSRHHGFDFLRGAARNGARGALVPDDRTPPDSLEMEWFRVPDTLRALGDLAGEIRRRSEVGVVGITGSSGKTTVKEMLADALAAARRVHRTRGNLNSQVGLPLAVLESEGDEDVWVLEMGSNAPGEIARLVEIARPDHGVVTTVGPAHLEGFGGVEGVLDEKLDLLRDLPEGGRSVVGERPDELAREARRIRPDVTVAGLDPASDYRPEEHRVAADHVWFRRQGVEFRVEGGGEHHLRDALLAAAAAEGLGLAPERVAEGLERFRPLGMRGDLRQLGDLTVVADCYNANPESFEAAIQYCGDVFAGRELVAVVGSMLELGEAAPDAHRRVADRLLRTGFSTVVATGEFVPAFRETAAASDGARVVPAEGPEEAGDRVVDALTGDEVVLVKGSRGAGLERVVERLEERFGEGG